MAVFRRIYFARGVGRMLCASFPLPTLSFVGKIFMPMQRPSRQPIRDVVIGLLKAHGCNDVQNRIPGHSIYRYDPLLNCTRAIKSGKSEKWPMEKSESRNNCLEVYNHAIVPPHRTDDVG
ncbi:hypothetical protein BS50DRAFT_253550 [Corynespora cassiicola Philippines]|uniref:Uncharacterized protein n=1 Tax=Corynespora cassiicola Philippines TaxID=1448308 RepID=A0A2T2P499_CORCC|nr:hypothetical protein BS50DRAFT_253550 [Corynespora cassiicola Philippines]